MSDHLAASDRAISRGLSRFLAAPEDRTEWCDACGKETPCRCPRCANCEERPCRYEDCGINENCSDCPDGAHTKAGDCIYSDAALARAEALHLEEGRDADRDGRA